MEVNIVDGNVILSKNFEVSGYQIKGSILNENSPVESVSFVLYDLEGFFSETLSILLFHI